MAMEIERKFLVQRDLWNPGSLQGQRYRQGYLADNDKCVVRVRVAGESAFITIKSRTTGVERLEFEYVVAVADAQVMLDALCTAVVEKMRYRVKIGETLWEVDEFEGANAGLLLAEVELRTVDDEYERPNWLGREVSYDARYFNSNLARNPYSEWRNESETTR